MVFYSRPPKERKEIKLFTRESSQQAKEEQEIFLGFLLILLINKLKIKARKKPKLIFFGFSQSFSNTQEESNKTK